MRAHLLTVAVFLLGFAVFAQNSRVYAPPPKQGTRIVGTGGRYQPANLNAVIDRLKPANAPNDAAWKQGVVEGLRIHGELIMELRGDVEALSAQIGSVENAVAASVDALNTALAEQGRAIASLQNDIKAIPAPSQSLPTWAWAAMAGLAAVGAGGMVYGFMASRAAPTALAVLDNYQAKATEGDLERIGDKLAGRRKGPVKRIWHQVRALWALASDSTAGWTVRTMAIGALLYLVSPIDAIPDAIPVVGLTDDVGVIVAAVGALSMELARYAEQRGTIDV